MDFFNDIGRSFDPKQNGLSNSIDNSNRAFEQAFDPNLNGVAASVNNTNTQTENIFDPNKNNVTNTFTNVGAGMRGAFNTIDQTFKNIFDGEGAKKFYGDTDNFFNHTVADNIDLSKNKTIDFLNTIPERVNQDIVTADHQVAGFSNGIMHILDGSSSNDDNKDVVIPKSTVQNKPLSSFSNILSGQNMPYILAGGGILLLLMMKK